MTLLFDKLDSNQNNLLIITELINKLNEDVSKLNCAQNARVYRIKLLKIALQTIDAMSKDSGD